MKSQYDALVIGSGPNGLAAAVCLAQRGLSVRVYEAAATVGGGARSAELTLPGFVHDVCSAIHPMAVASPFLRTLPLHEHGLTWIHSPLALVHPFDTQPAAVIERSLEATIDRLETEGGAYDRLMRPLVESADIIFDELLGPLRIPRHLRAAIQFGLRGIQSADHLTQQRFKLDRTQALFAGVAGHSMLPLTNLATAAIGLMLLTAAHAHGWPLPRGGAQAISDALASYFRSLGGEIVLEHRVADLRALPPAKAVLLDLTPRQILALEGSELPSRYRRALERYRYGLGAYKVDWALSEPIPWRDPAASQAATVHVGGTTDELILSEQSAWEGKPPERPFLIVTQPSLFDPTRAPVGKHTAWAYCHVPNGSQTDMLERVEQQMERFAPGFRDCVLDRHVLSPASLERYNANYVGGDINGGSQELAQLFTRPVVRLRPYRTGNRRLYICSSSTPPGGGVHGMCGWFAAQTAIRDHF